MGWRGKKLKVGELFWQGGLCGHQWWGALRSGLLAAEDGTRRFPDADIPASLEEAQWKTPGELPK